MENKIKLIFLECVRCGHVYLPRTSNPVNCPRCQAPFLRYPPKVREKVKGEEGE